MQIIITNTEVLAVAKVAHSTKMITSIIPDKIVLDKFESNLLKAVAGTKSAKINRDATGFTFHIEPAFFIDVIELGGDFVKGIYSLTMGLIPSVKQLEKKWQKPAEMTDDLNALSWYKTTSNTHTPITFMKSNKLVVDTMVFIGIMIDHTNNTVSTVPAYIEGAHCSSYPIYVKDNYLYIDTDKAVCDFDWIGEYQAVDSLPLGDRSFYFFDNTDDLTNFLKNWF